MSFRRIFDYIDGFATSDYRDAISVAPPTFLENLTTCLLLFLGLAGVFCLVVGAAYIIMALLTHIERRRGVRYGVRRVL